MIRASQQNRTKNITREMDFPKVFRFFQRS